MIFATLLSLALAVNTTFTQLQCQDSTCLLCDVYVFSEGNCNTAQSGFTAKGYCLSSGIFQQQLWDNIDCTGTPFSVTNIPLSTCVQSVGDTYFENICDSTVQQKAHYNKTVQAGTMLYTTPSL